jgi:hypothetical protein
LSSIVLGVALVAACADDDRSRPATSVLAEKVGPSTQETFELGRGLTLEVEKGDLAEPTKLSTASAAVDPPDMPWYEPVGTATVKFDAAFNSPVSLTFDGSQGRPRDDAVPMIWRHDDTRGWYPIAVGTEAKDAPRASAERTLFSPISWGWARVTGLSNWVSHNVRKLLGHRSERLSCTAEPDWFEVTPPAQDVVHTCATSNLAPDGVTSRGEVQLRNNRGFAIEVEIPTGVAYAHVDGQPEAIRKVVRVFTGRDSALLLPGQIVTIGFAQPTVNAIVPLPVSLSPAAMLATLVAEAAGGEDALLGAVTLLSKCSTLPVPLNFHRGIDGFGELVQSATSCITGILSDPDGAALVATEFIAATAGVDTVTAAADRSLARKIDGLAGKLKMLAAVPLGSELLDAFDDLYTQTVVGDLNSMTPLAEMRGSSPVRRTPPPVTREDLTRIDLPFSMGIDALPQPCRAYWHSYDPIGNGLSMSDNSIVVLDAGMPDVDRDGSTDSIALGDVDDDGVNDGIASFSCNTNGSFGPSGVLVLLAKDRSIVTNIEEEVGGAHETQFGDSRYGFSAPVSAIPAEERDKGDLIAYLGSYRQSDANCCPSAFASATFELEDGALHLLRLEEDIGD